MDRFVGTQPPRNDGGVAKGMDRFVAARHGRFVPSRLRPTFPQ